MNCFFRSLLAYPFFRAIFLAGHATILQRNNIICKRISCSIGDFYCDCLCVWEFVSRNEAYTHERYSHTHTSAHRPIAQFPVFHTNYYYLLFVVAKYRLRIHHCEFMCFYIRSVDSCLMRDCFDMASVWCRWPHIVGRRLRRFVCFFFFFWIHILELEIYGEVFRMYFEFMEIFSGENRGMSWRYNVCQWLNIVNANEYRNELQRQRQHLHIIMWVSRRRYRFFLSLSLSLLLYAE